MDVHGPWAYLHGMAVRLGHRPALDALRAFAVLAVIGAHAGIPGTRYGGYVGVEVFFVLSGFLITTVLLSHPVRLGGFYGRRARRLLPALFALLAVVAPVAFAVRDTATVNGAIAGIAYISDFARAQSMDLGGLGHLWSLAIEEQFYVLWPLVVIACRTARRVLAFALVVAFSLAVRRAFLDAPFERLYNSLDTRAVGLLIGCALGAAARLYPIAVARRWGWVAAGFLVFLVSVDVGLIYEGFRSTFVLVDLLTVVCICAFLDVARIPRPLEWVGQRSYALYLWHFVFLYVAGRLERFDAVSAACIGAAFLAAEVSWRLVERRWMVPHDPKASMRDAATELMPTS